MAGAAGFEPTHGRIKTCCLTAWRRPCIEFPTSGIHFLCQACHREVQRRPVATPSDEARQSGWKLARDFISLLAIWEAPKYTSSSAGHFCWNKIVQQYQSVTNFAVALLNHRLTVVMTAPLRKAANCNGRSITCQLRVGKNFCCTYRHLRRKHQVPGLFRVDRNQSLAHALGERRATAHEHRHVGAQGQAQLGQLLLAPV